jgi:hypothetical protein
MSHVTAVVFEMAVNTCVFFGTIGIIGFVFVVVCQWIHKQLKQRDII